MITLGSVAGSQGDGHCDAFKPGELLKAAVEMQEEAVRQAAQAAASSKIRRGAARALQRHRKKQKHAGDRGKRTARSSKQSKLVLLRTVVEPASAHAVL